jgi:hypothetical protein
LNLIASPKLIKDLKYQHKSGDTERLEIAKKEVAMAKVWWEDGKAPTREHGMVGFGMVWLTDDIAFSSTERELRATYSSTGTINF